MIFKPGDPVWAHTDGHAGIKRGEYAAVVIDLCVGGPNHVCMHNPHFPGQQIDVLGVACPSPGKTWCSGEQYLRPRRDDYQQHEDKVTRYQLDKTLRETQWVARFKHDTDTVSEAPTPLQILQAALASFK